MKNIVAIAATTAVVGVAAGFGAGFGVGWASKDGGGGTNAGGEAFSGAATAQRKCITARPGARPYPPYTVVVTYGKTILHCTP